MVLDCLLYFWSDKLFNKTFSRISPNRVHFARNRSLWQKVALRMAGNVQPARQTTLPQPSQPWNWPALANAFLCSVTSMWFTRNNLVLWKSALTELLADDFVVDYRADRSAGGIIKIEDRKWRQCSKNIRTRWMFSFCFLYVLRLWSAVQRKSVWHEKQGFFWT